MKRFIYRTEGRIGYLTLNRPEKYNAFDRLMVEELASFLGERRYDHHTRIIILDGGDAKGFCAGLDTDGYAKEIAAMPPVEAYNAQAQMARLFLALRKIPQPVIACIHGAAAGIGFSLAMAADVRILSEDARFSAAYINIGLGGADMASSYFLPRLIGSGRANEYLLTGNWMDASTAMAVGFGSRLIPRESMLKTAEELAQTMVSKHPLGLRMTKEALNVNIDATGLEACLQLEDRSQMMVAYTYRMDGSTGEISRK